MLAINKNLWNGSSLAVFYHFGQFLGVETDIDFGVAQPLATQQGLGGLAVRAVIFAVDDDLFHDRYPLLVKR